MANVKAIFIAENSAPTDIVPSATAVDYSEQLITSDDVGFSEESAESSIISADRNPRGSVRIAINGQGTIASELLFGGQDKLMEAALAGADWAPQQSGDTTPFVTAAMTLTLAHGSFTITAASGTPFTGLAVGDWIRLENTGAVNDDLVVRISEATSATVIVYDSWSRTPTDETSTAGYTIRNGEFITIGTTERLLTEVRRVEQAGATLIEVVLGLLIDGMQLNMAQGAIPTLSFPVRARKMVPEFDGVFRLDTNGDVVGSGGTSLDFATMTSTGYTAAPANAVMSPVETKSAIMIDGVPSVVAKSFALNLANNSFGERVLFRQGDAYNSLGRVSVAGSFEAIFVNGTLLTAFFEDTELRLALYTQDIDGNGFVFDIPKARLGGGGEAIQGEGMVTTNFTFSARKDSVTGRALQIVRFRND